MYKCIICQKHFAKWFVAEIVKQANSDEKLCICVGCKVRMVESRQDHYDAEEGNKRDKLN